MPRKHEHEEHRVVPGTQAIARALSVLRCVARTPGGASVQDIVRAMGLSRSTIVRLLDVLHAQQLVRVDPLSGRFLTGVGALELASCYISSNDIRRVSLPFLWKLAQDSRETVNLNVLDDLEVVCIEQVEGPQQLRVVNWLSQRFLINNTAAGKGIVAFLPEEERNDIISRLVGPDGRLPAPTDRTITDVAAFVEHCAQARRRGYAVAEDEFELGLVAVGAPVYDHTGSVVGSVTLAAPTFRMDRERLDEVGCATVEAARGISSALGHAPEAPGARLAGARS